MVRGPSCSNVENAYPLPCSSMTKRGVSSPTAPYGRGFEASSHLDRSVSVHRDSPPFLHVSSDDVALKSHAKHSEDSAMAASSSSMDVQDTDFFCGADDLEVGRNVPGSMASSFRIQSMWNGLTRMILNRDTAFSSFFRSMLRKPEGHIKLPRTASVWPMPLPYDLTLCSPHIDGDTLSFRKLLNLQVAFLSHLHLNCPRIAPHEICGHHNLTEDQWSVLRRLTRLGEAWKFQPVYKAEDLGRTAAKQEQQEAVISELDRFVRPHVSQMKKYGRSISSVNLGRPSCKSVRGRVVGKLTKTNISGAHTIVADRIKMEGTPSFDPCPFLDCKSRDLYQNPFCNDVDLDDARLNAPRVRVHASTHEKLRLLKLLQDSGRLSFRKPSDVYEGLGNGLFAVPKNTKVDRLILDGRPANLLQIPPNRFIMTMAGAHCLLGIHLRSDEKLLMSGDDLSNFFYTFRVNGMRVSRNFLEWKIPTRLVKDFKSFPGSLCDEKYVYACMASLAMGDSAACEYAQTSHISMGLQCGAFRKHHLLTMHGRVPRSRFMAGIIIDDFVLLERVALNATNGLELASRRSSMHSMYSSVGLEAHPSKGFAEQESASFWGADVDGLAGLVRGHIPRAASLCWVTSKVASLGYCSISLLEVIAGGFVSLFTFRRRMMSLLDLVYVIQCGRERAEIISLSPPVIDELWSLVVLCPLAVSDLRADFSDRIYMVDASNWGDAVVSAPLKGGLPAEIHRHSVNKSCWTRLLSPFKAHLRGKGCLDPAEELPGEESFTEHPVWEVAARGLCYTLDWKKRAKNGRHINLGELHAYLKAEVLGAADGDKRVAIGSDSQVCLGCICKGRSASPCLNNALKRSLAVVLGNGIYSSGGYERSAHNPADDPTRGVPLRDAVAELPSWWLSLENYQYDELDSFLKSCNLHPDQISGYPNLNELQLQSPEVVGDLLCDRGIKKFQAKLKSKLVLRHLQKEQKSHRHSSTSALKCEFKDGTLSEIHEALISFGKDQFLLSIGENWPPTRPGFIDLYSGKKGFAKAAIRYGAPWVLCVDIEDGAQCDLLCPSVRRRIEFLVKSGVCLHLSAAPICSSFSRAITPAVRSRDFPKGLAGVSKAMFLKIQDGNSHSTWLAKIISLCLVQGILFWVENPDSSFLWLQPEWISLPHSAADNFYKCDFCSFGTAWRKRTRFVTNGSLSGTRRLCQGGHRHLVLRGRSKVHKAPWTKIAEPYPARLCATLAHSACSDLGLFKGTFDCTAFVGHRRVGEAKNPGPRRARYQGTKDPSQLDRVELIRPATIAIGEKHWHIFVTWLENFLGKETSAGVWIAPQLLATMLAAFGRHWFSIGGSLFNFRHLLIFSQRKYPILRGNMQSAWNVISKWEELEPVEHRRPLPYAIVKAMVVLALQWSWRRVAAVILLSFHACTRPGEVLNAFRRDVVLPSDLGAEPGSPCYLRILKPKPGRRGLGRTQHAKVRDTHSSHILSDILGQLKPEERIFPGSGGSFRTRWDHLLRRLKVPGDCNFSPGCLRAGGTVHLYQLGVPIMDILWALRLKNLETLQHYLQEISTQVTMIDLPYDCKALIHGFSFFFDLLHP